MEGSEMEYELPAELCERFSCERVDRAGQFQTLRVAYEQMPAAARIRPRVTAAGNHMACMGAVMMR